MNETTQDVIIDTAGATGVITLNRPKALNALSTQMIAAITAALEEWRDIDSVKQVIIESSSEKFCAGGDVRAARQQLIDGDIEAVQNYFDAEYEMDYLIATYPKPVISLMSGVIMGGGLGLTAHGSHRVITRDAFAAMPEMKIGYFVDVGMTYLLQRLPGHPSQALGAFISLTGYRLSADDMMATGLATHLVESAKELGELRQALIDGVDVFGDDKNFPFAEPGESELARHYGVIEQTFTGSWPQIRGNVDEVGGEFKELVDKHCEGASPSSLVATAELVLANDPKKVDLRGALDNEEKLQRVILREPDFVEGVRAVLVDKDNARFAPEPDPEHYRQVLGG